jgi:hypothetical protein
MPASTVIREHHHERRHRLQDRLAETRHVQLFPATLVVGTACVDIFVHRCHIGTPNAERNDQQSRTEIHSAVQSPD